MRSEPVQVRLWQDKESELVEPLELRPPAALALQLSPPVDPNGERWRVALLAGRGQHPVVIERDVFVSEDGTWRREDLPVGPYRLLVLDGQLSTWLRKKIEVAEGSVPVHIELHPFRVSGRVLLGPKPFRGRVTLVSQGGGVRQSFSTDQEGEFEGHLPQTPDEVRWSAYVESTAPAVRRHIEVVELERTDGSDDAHVEIRLPDTAITGRVVSPDGTPWREAAVVFAQDVSEGHGITQISIRPEDGGAFRLEGVPAGEHRVYGESRGCQSGSAFVHVLPDSTAPPLTLILQEQIDVRARVVSQEGPGIPGALVVAHPADQPWVSVRPIRTDADGRFTLPVSPHGGEVVLNVSALGFTYRMLRRFVGPGQELTIVLESWGGALVVEGVDGVGSQRSTYVFHNGAFQGLVALGRWSAANGETSSDSRLRIPQMTAGDYMACRLDPSDVGSLISGRPAPDRCAVGSLSLGGELVLRAPTPR
jgi:hypothetical protein